MTCHSVVKHKWFDNDKTSFSLSTDDYNCNRALNNYKLKHLLLKAQFKSLQSDTNESIIRPTAFLSNNVNELIKQTNQKVKKLQITKWLQI